MGTEKDKHTKYAKARTKYIYYMNEQNALKLTVLYII